MSIHKNKGVTMEELVEKYIQLRDKKAELSADFKARTAKLDAVISKIEGVLLSQFNELGMESVRTKAGTAYKSTRASATVADWDNVLDFIQRNELWNMLEHRVNKSAVEQFKEEHGDLPPGVNWREEVVVNVRRS
jgi:hypothetical protein